MTELYKVGDKLPKKIADEKDEPVPADPADPTTADRKLDDGEDDENV